MNNIFVCVVAFACLSAFSMHTREQNILNNKLFTELDQLAFFVKRKHLLDNIKKTTQQGYRHCPARISTSSGAINWTQFKILQKKERIKNLIRIGAHCSGKTKSGESLICSLAHNFYKAAENGDAPGMEGSLESLKLLAAMGANLQVRGKGGKNIAHYLVGHPKGLELIKELRKKSNFNIKNLMYQRSSDYKIPWEIFLKNGFTIKKRSPIWKLEDFCEDLHYFLRLGIDLEQTYSLNALGLYALTAPFGNKAIRLPAISRLLPDEKLPLHEIAHRLYRYKKLLNEIAHQLCCYKEAWAKKGMSEDKSKELQNLFILYALCDGAKTINDHAKDVQLAFKKRSNFARFVDVAVVMKK